MAIAKMNKVYLIGHQDEKDNTLSILQQVGMMEIGDIQAKEASKEAWAELVEGDHEQESLQGLEARLTEVRFAMDFLNRYYPVKKSMLEALGGDRKAVTTSEFVANAAEWNRVASDIYRELRKTDEKLMSLRNEETRLQNLKTLVLPWEQLAVPLEEIYSTASVCIELGTLPAAELAALRERLLAAAKESYLAEVHVDRNEVYVFLAYPASLAEEVREILKQVGFNKQVFPALAGTPVEILARVGQELVMIAEQRKEILADTEKQVEFRDILSYYYDYLVMERDKKQVVTNLARTNNAFIMEGWIREKDLPELEKKLSAGCDTVVAVAREPEPGEHFPVSLENTRLVAPFEFITTLYGVPHPHGVDPTLALTPFFVMFFGLCMSDAGYGVVIAALAALALWKLKMSKMARRVFWILLAGGISTIIFGALIGGWFGGLIPLEPLFFNALLDPMRMLVYALAIGVFQIFVGMGIQFYHNIRAGKILDAISDQLFWGLFIIGLIMFAFPELKVVATNLSLASAAGLVLTQGRAQTGIFRKFLSGLFSLYNVTGFLGDILSYSRLLALGLASSVIAMAVNMLAFMLGGTIIGSVLMVIMLIGGHTFNIVINILGSYVHSSRLQYLEFFNRFFVSGGRPFKPFKLNTNYVEVTADWPGVPLQKAAQYKL
ncbi:MAG: V-type ATP synthase subunit I [Dethiobacter sp.]|jgi:V/A-type H+-transporting ATPase subunit I|nr:MAG: V-type ATP synthase subunit I [Dethiobacter sp.]